MKVGEVEEVVALFGKVYQHSHWKPLLYPFETFIFD